MELNFLLKFGFDFNRQKKRIVVDENFMKKIKRIVFEYYGFECLMEDNSILCLYSSYYLESISEFVGLKKSIKFDNELSLTKRALECHLDIVAILGFNDLLKDYSSEEKKNIFGNLYGEYYITMSCSDYIVSYVKKYWGLVNINNTSYTYNINFKENSDE